MLLSRRLGIAAPAVRAIRGLWPDRSPLRRGVDMAEALIASAPPGAQGGNPDWRVMEPQWTGGR